MVLSEASAGFNEMSNFLSATSVRLGSRLGIMQYAIVHSAS